MSLLSVVMYGIVCAAVVLACDAWQRADLRRLEADDRERERARWVARHCLVRVSFGAEVALANDVTRAARRVS